MPIVGFTGSRSLRGKRFAELVERVVRAVAGNDRYVVVGCAVGADQFVLDAALRADNHPEIFAAFGPEGVGSWKASNVLGVLDAADRPGVRVTWWAGGGRDVPLGARLTRRSAAMVRRVAESGTGRGLIAFLAPNESPGTIGTMLAAIRLGVPVICFPIDGANLPRIDNGHWHRAGRGVWSNAFKWAD